MRNIKISLSVIVLLVILFSFEKLYIIGALVLAICIHEFGHIIAIRALGGKIGQCTLALSGMNIHYTGGISYIGECAIAAAGGVANVLAFLCCMPFALNIKTDELIFFCAINILLFSFNMLPALPLDGGIFVRALLSEICDYDLAEKITNASTFVIGCAIMFCGIIICIITKGNITLIVASVIILRQPTMQRLF